MPAIETNSLSKRFGDVVAVDDLSLQIDDGEVFGFLGPNGAGKSTTINMLLDFARPTGGSATVLGYDTQKESQKIRKRVGVLPEGFDLYERLSGRKHIEFAQRAKGANGDPVEYLERVGLGGDPADRNAGDYSKGMKQRLAFGMALVGEPDLLIMDEPSSGLDPTGIREMQEIVREEAERGTTVFFSSHILDHVEEVCDRIGVMNEGELVAVGTLDELHARIGGDAHLELSVDDVPERTVDTLPDIAGVSGATARNGTLDVTCTESAAKAKAINHVEDAGTTVLDIQVEDQDIDDLFAELTGNGSTHAEGDTPEEVVA
ncbi:ABC transporter ATP-binding protein [Natranaeroarchaeum sulfidigenes]|uniref:ABC-type multidrug transport system, ATPase component n=1 Tax=Natranaeroarchaeum sulfidigenes TaxID=2784880 RepID=A0A897MR43_9EURY|nr:ABC transporter ATP-binding protein [Natranaeroarchaeum sulfidigenes]QSG01449.1 ABC-type multidrug transport system, ATPase component [Natranaeroarchaeum sulfidigenes]